MQNGLLIAIDGPVASGKGTIAKLLAKKINGVHLNTGSMYRALAFKCINLNIDFKNKELVLKTLKDSQIELEPDKNGESKIFLDGNDISKMIYTPEISNGSSFVALIPEVAMQMVKLQRMTALKLSRNGINIVIEGRQIGTEVLPDADIKIFLTADIKERASRRLAQYKAKGIEKSLKEEILETEKRDRLDSNREYGALPSNPQSLGYFVLNNSGLTEQETLDVIINQLKKKGVWNG